jgi:hypothetical protein
MTQARTLAAQMILVLSTESDRLSVAAGKLSIPYTAEKLDEAKRKIAEAIGNIDQAVEIARMVISDSDQQTGHAGTAS